MAVILPLATIRPPATIGMLGGGQLGRYALVVAKLMGYRTIVLDPDPGAPAGAMADEHLIAAYDDPAALERLIETCDVVTTEFENPPAAALDVLAASVRIAPSPAAVRIAQDRIAEKQFLADHEFPVGPHAVLDVAVGGLDQLPDSLLDADVVLKTARLGYDGKGQRRVRGLTELTSAWDELGRVPCVVEAMLDLQTEVSVIVGRSADGSMRTWPVAENTHTDGILDVSVVPAAIDNQLADQATGLACAIAQRLDYVGVLAVELFVVGTGDDTQLLVNEMAPRPHNSGHWTLDASVTSQYEQQVRAICGVGLGDTAMTSAGVAMVNLLGDIWPEGGQPDWAVVLAHPGAKLHLYGKSEARPGRKMGHLTVLADSSADAAREATALRSAL
jgi:5-(carboxyamino)imidazole ribonucleotide synthase